MSTCQTVYMVATHVANKIIKKMSNATDTTYFTTFLQTADVANSY